MKRDSRFRVWLGLLLWLTATTGCKHTQTPTSPVNSMEMKPYQEPSYTQSLPLSPRNDLLKALGKAGADKRIVKIPVVLRLANDGLRGWQEAYLGTQPMDDEDKIVLRLSDSALGVSLADRIHQYCPTGEWCKLWLTGYWAEDMPTVDKGSDPSKFPFGIRAVLGAQAEGDKALVFLSGK